MHTTIAPGMHRTHTYVTFTPTKSMKDPFKLVADSQKHYVDA